jgi:hypothetical protein
MKIADLFRCIKIRQLRQRRAENLSVLPAVAGMAEGATHRMINKDGARRRDSGHDVQHRADDQSWNGMVFDDMGDETDGLMAERSIGDEQCQINVGSL